MKTRVLVLCGLLGAFAANGQRNFIMWPTDSKTDKIIFTESVPFPTSDPTLLFSKAVSFFKTNYKGERDTVAINDAKETIFCKSAYFIPIKELAEKGQGYISYTFTVWCHKNYYTYALTDLQHYSLAANGAIGGALENDRTLSGPMLFPDKYWNDQKAKCYYRIQTTIEQLKSAMSRAIGS